MGRSLLLGHPVAIKTASKTNAGASMEVVYRHTIAEDSFLFHSSINGLRLQCTL